MPFGGLNRRSTTRHPVLPEDCSNPNFNNGRSATDFVLNNFFDVVSNSLASSPAENCTKGPDAFPEHPVTAKNFLDNLLTTG